VQKQKAHRQSALAMGSIPFKTKFSGQQLSRASVNTRTTTGTTLAPHLPGKAHLLLTMVGR
jgi:hypothetical protein